MNNSPDYIALFARGATIQSYEGALEEMRHPPNISYYDPGRYLACVGSLFSEQENAPNNPIVILEAPAAVPRKVGLDTIVNRVRELAGNIIPIAILIHPEYSYVYRRLPVWNMQIDPEYLNPLAPKQLAKEVEQWDLTQVFSANQNPRALMWEILEWARQPIASVSTKKQYASIKNTVLLSDIALNKLYKKEKSSTKIVEDPPYAIPI